MQWTDPSHTHMCKPWTEAKFIDWWPMWVCCVLHHDALTRTVMRTNWPDGATWSNGRTNHTRACTEWCDVALWVVHARSVRMVRCGSRAGLPSNRATSHGRIVRGGPSALPAHNPSTWATMSERMDYRHVRRALRRNVCGRRYRTSLGHRPNFGEGQVVTAHHHGDQAGPWGGPVNMTDRN